MSCAASGSACSGLAALLSLISLPNRGNLVGSLGDALSGWITWLVGAIVAFVVPALLLWWGWLAFRGQRPQHSWVRWTSALVLIVSACALIGLIKRGVETEVAMHWSGVIGCWLVTDDSMTLNLPRYIGVVGTTLLFSGLALVGLLLATDVLFMDVAKRIGALALRVWARIVTWLGIVWRGPCARCSYSPRTRRKSRRRKIRPSSVAAKCPSPTTRVLNSAEATIPTREPAPGRIR